MFVRILQKSIRPLLHRTILHHQTQSFIIMKLFKQKMQQNQKSYKFKEKPRTQTYSASNEEKKEEEEEQYIHDEKKYDYFSRYREMEMNKDFRKIKEMGKFIPEDVGKGGFDEVVFWSQNAESPEQIISLVSVFNRMDQPETIADELKFQQFCSKVFETIYLAQTINQILQLSIFAQKFFISDERYWSTIEQKTILILPKTPSQTQDFINILFTMSKCEKGQLIFSKMSSTFKEIDISAVNTSKLLVAYYNLKEGEKQFIESLFNKVTANINQIPKQIFVTLYEVFKESKHFSSENQKIVLERTEELIHSFTLKQLCMTGDFIGFDKMGKQFWRKMEERGVELLKDKKISTRDLFQLIDLVSAFSVSTQFVRKYFMNELQKDKCKVLYKYPPQVLSKIAKILFIYQLNDQSKDISEIVETIIMKQFNNLSNVEIQNLLLVIRDFTVTRNGSRQLYIFLSEVIEAKFDGIKDNRAVLVQLYEFYSKSNLCQASLLKKIEFLIE